MLGNVEKRFEEKRKESVADLFCLALDFGDELIPEKYKGEWNEWLKEGRDWCISRQLWWGHRIPAYHRKSRKNNEEEEEDFVVARSAPELEGYEQEDDVLDTWFSSALFPLVNKRKKRENSLKTFSFVIRFQWDGQITWIEVDTLLV